MKTKKLLSIGERSELMEKLETLFEEADENMQRRALYKLTLENWDSLNHNGNTLYRIENVLSIMNRELSIKDKEIIGGFVV